MPNVTFVTFHGEQHTVEVAAGVSLMRPGRLPRAVQHATLGAAAALCAIVVFAPAAVIAAPGAWSRSTHYAYAVLARPAWSAGVALVLLVTGAHPEHVVSRALAAPTWRPFARLSLGALLSAPIVAQVGAFTAVDFVRFTPSGIAANYVAVAAYAYALAAVLFALVQQPALTLEALACSRGRRAHHGHGGGGGGGAAAAPQRHDARHAGARAGGGGGGSAVRAGARGGADASPSPYWRKGGGGGAPALGEARVPLLGTPN